MKKLNWKHWTAIGITAALLITGIVLHFKQPEVSYAFTEAVAAVSFVAGGAIMYLLKAKNIIDK